MKGPRAAYTYRGDETDTNARAEAFKAQIHFWNEEIADRKASLEAETRPAWRSLAKRRLQTARNALALRHQKLGTELATLQFLQET